MALDKYQTLMTVVDAGSLTRAAEQLGCTQSAVSHSLDALEKELGFALIKRSRAGVRLTGEGERLLPAVRGFLSAAEVLADLGYEEVNLNLGCPSGTVVSKGRGAGFLERQRELERFLGEIYEKAPVRVSIKTRVGVDYEEEWEELLTLYNRFPIPRLIVHPRLRRDYYKGAVRMELFRRAVEESRNRLVYNGDLFTTGQIEGFEREFPQIEAVMLGRGLVRNPALVRELRGGARLEKRELRAFHDGLMEEYRGYLSGERPLLFKMKEMWSYWLELFPQAGKSAKLLRKCRTLSAYATAVAGIFAGDMVV
jgi:tRNA-dihydrouridine synthase